MIENIPHTDAPMAVFGLGRSGLSTARALAASGAAVWAWDDSEQGRQAANDAGVNLVDLYACDWQDVASLVLSPGIPLTHPTPHPVVELARAAGCEVIGDVELLARAETNPTYIGITGTNGKSTTTALIGHVFGVSGSQNQIGGNLGTPVLDFDAQDEHGACILEMSSYQLDLTQTLAFDVAVLLNISPDHLDRHGGMDGYIAAKKRIFDKQDAQCTAIVGIDDEASRRIFEDLKNLSAQTVIPVSGSGRAPGGVYVEGGMLVDDTNGQAGLVLDLRDAPALPGVHNAQNAAAAYAAARTAGIDADTIATAIRTYPGLPHRQERIGEIEGVTFINDSKATNAEAAARALDCYSAVYWIAGGRAKDDGLHGIEAHLANVRHVFLIGEASDVFARQLEGQCGYTLCGDLQTAARIAHDTARDDLARGVVEAPMVVLSPAAASFDQFTNFEVRGDAFRDWVTGVAA